MPQESNNIPQAMAGRRLNDLPNATSLSSSHSQASKPSGNSGQGKRHTSLNPTSYSKMVTIIAGSGATREQFNIHEDVITRCSPFIKAACIQAHQQDEERSIEIPSVQAHIFSLYCDWVYSTRSSTPSDPVPGTPKCLADHGQGCTRVFCVSTSRVYAYLQLWTAADFLDDQKLAIEVSDALRLIVENATCELTVDCFLYVLDVTKSGDAMQRLILDWITFRGSIIVLNDPALKVAQLGSFWQDLALHQMQVWNVLGSTCRPSKAVKCRYHDHKDGRMCNGPPGDSLPLSG